MNLGDSSTFMSGAFTRRQVFVGASLAFAGIGVTSVAWGETGDGISHNAEAIHQEPVFKADRKRVYEALTTAAQFHQATLLSEAVRVDGLSVNKPTVISRDIGGEFSLYGGYITGRHVELVPNERIVQVWRAGGWEPGAHSIVRFELKEEGSGCRIVFHHKGFPDGTAEHLARGWKGNYWEPLAKLLA